LEEKKELMEIRSFRLASVCAVALGVGGCVTLPTAFTTENVMSVRQGMESDEILKLFGTPKNVRQAVCGASTGKSRSCTTWEYGEFPYDRASFTFDSDSGVLILNNFDVHRSGGTLPKSFTTKNVLKVHQGIGSDEILMMFGTPKNVRQAVCGASTGRPWTCITWEYGEFPYDRASFTFAEDGGTLILNNFDVQRK
jgi:hypothetical protein